jgi:hypothetical protein
MATAIIKKNDPVATALAGVTGAATGFSEGEKEKEKSRQFNVQAEQQARQWNAEMEYKYAALLQMASENKLNRDQQDRFAQLTDIRERQLQTQRLDTQTMLQDDQQEAARFLQDDEQGFRTVENERDRAVTRRGQDLTYDIGKKNWQLGGSQLDLQRNELQSREGYKVNLGVDLLKGQDFNMMSPEAQQQILLEWTNAVIGAARVNADPSVNPATEDEFAQAYVAGREYLSNFGQAQKAYQDKLISLYSAKAMNTQDMESPSGTTNKVVFGEVDDNWRKPLGQGLPSMFTLTGGPPRDPSTMGALEKKQHDQIMNEIIPQAYVDAQKFEPGSRSIPYNEYKKALSAVIEGPDSFIQDQYKQSYYKALGVAVYGPKTERGGGSVAPPITNTPPVKNEK